MTEEVTEMPRYCSKRIQSEVAWRAALRPLTVPAIWMAPPNSSSFSVSVVLPSSGCEMIAKVRCRAISAARSVLRCSRSGQVSVGAAQGELEHGSILATARRLIVAAPPADLLEAHRQVQTDRRGVGGPHLQIRGSHAGRGGARDQGSEQALAQAAAAERLVHTQIEDVGLARTDTHDPVTEDLAAHRHHAANVPEPPTIYEDPLAPGKLVSAALDVNHLRYVGRAHGSNHDLGRGLQQLRSGCHQSLRHG